MQLAIPDFPLGFPFGHALQYPSTLVVLKRPSLLQSCAASLVIGVGVSLRHAVIVIAVAMFNAILAIACSPHVIGKEICRVNRSKQARGWDSNFPHLSLCVRTAADQHHKGDGS